MKYLLYANAIIAHKTSDGELSDHTIGYQERCRIEITFQWSCTAY